MSLSGTLIAILAAGSVGAGTIPSTVQPTAGQSQVSQNTQMTFDQLQACVTAGQAVCDYEMGRRYFMGQGLPQDYKLSFYWYQKAAQKGNVSGMLMTASAYEGGAGTAKNDTLAFQWYSKAAAAGDMVSMDAMGRYYERGGPVTADRATALNWYTQAANKGLGSAMGNLARMYEADGKMDLALDWGKKAARANSVWAAYTVGEIYYNGRGGIKADPAQAFPWYEMAAYWNLPQAQYQLARMYYNAEGVKNDDIEAYVWMTIAAERGEVNAQEDFATIKDQVTPQQIEAVTARRRQRLQEIETRSKAAGIYVYPLSTSTEAVKPLTQ